MKRLLRALPIGLALLAPSACDDDKGGTVDATVETTPDTTGSDATEETLEETGADAADTADTTETPDTSPTETTETGETGETAEPACVATEPLCSDEQIRDLALSDEASGGPIAEEISEPGVFISHIDATAGGFNGSGGYTYARFTATGLVSVDLSDEASLESTDWDIAARRFVLRLNSGVSGPSCVTGGRTVPGTEFDALTVLPQGVTLRKEQYFDADSCEYVPDTSGIGSPQTVLSSFWAYPGCVAMTGNIYVVALADGRHVKLQVLSYYTPSAQDVCDETGAAPTPNGSGNLLIKWAFID